MSPLRVIFLMTLREAARRRILSVSLILSAAMLVLYAVPLWIISEHIPSNLIARQQTFKILLTLGMYVVNMLMVMLAVFTSADTLAGEIRSGVMQTVAAKPLRRSQIVLGKWGAYAALLAGYLIVVGGGVAALVYGFGGFYSKNFPQALAAMWLEGLLLLSITMWAGARMSTLAAGVTAIGLHGIAFLGGWIEEIGRGAESAAAEQAGVIASVLFPTEALWRRAAYELQHPILTGISGGPFSVKVVPSDWMVLYAALYAAFALGMAIRTFSRRDI